MNRADFQALADVRIAEAQALFAAGMFDGAYYLAGYAVEYALKACIAKLTSQYDFPDEKFARSCFTHQIEQLVRVAGLKVRRDTDAPFGSTRDKYWTEAYAWTESSRYERHTHAKARDLIEAVTDPTNGVLPWIKVRW